MGLMESGIGVAFLGPSGVGKSRLLHELGDRAERSGMTLVRAVAAESTRSIPFAPFVELLPEGPTQDRLAMFRQALRSLQERSSQRGLVLAIDDAHHLDPGSLAFVINTVSSGSAIVCLTARSGSEMDPDLVALWTNGVIERADIEPLDRVTTRAVAEARLGPVNDDLASELWRLSAGNPLVLHELIEGAMGGSLQRSENGVWAQVGELATSSRLADLVTSRLRALPPELRAGMELVAVGSPLPLETLQYAMDDEIPRLEDRGFIAVTEIAGRPAVIAGHPLYGEILAANLAETRHRSICRTLVEASLGSADTTDPLRVAIWQRDSGETLSPQLALTGGAQALIRHDPGLAEQLVRPLGTGDERASLILGRALSYQQRFEEAEQVLGDMTPEDEVVLSEVASVRAQNLGFGLGRISEAKDLLAHTAGSIADPAMRARLNNERGIVSAISGDFLDARMASRAVLSDEGSDEVARVAAYVTLTLALAMTADCHGLDEVIEEATTAAGKHRAELPFARDQIEIMHLSSMLAAGRIPDAVDLGGMRVERTDRGNAMSSTWYSAHSLALEAAGKLASAAEVATTAMDRYRDADPFGLEAQSRGMLALALGQMGDPGALASIEGLVLAAPAPRLTVWVDRGRAWSAVVEGDIDGASRITVDGGRVAASGEHFAWAMLCFHDAVRFGRPDLVVEDMTAIDTSKGAGLLALMRDHAVVSFDSDPKGLSAVAEGFGDLGAHLLAAETWAQTANVHEGNGDLADAARACARSIAHEQRCERPDTPALRRRPSLVSVREIEVALDAASGLTSFQISEKRFISVRTVDNHLSSVYRKLAITGRDQLAGVLG